MSPYQSTLGSAGLNLKEPAQAYQPLVHHLQAHASNPSPVDGLAKFEAVAVVGDGER